MNLTTNKLLLFVCITIIGVFVNDYKNFKRRQKVVSLMKSRNSDMEQFDAYFSGLFNPYIADEIRSILSGFLSSDLTYLLPTDRFNLELGLDIFGRNKMLLFIHKIDEKFKVNLPYVEKCENMTFGQFVRIVDEMVIVTPT